MGEEIEVKFHWDDHSEIGFYYLMAGSVFVGSIEETGTRWRGHGSWGDDIVLPRGEKMAKAKFISIVRKQLGTIQATVTKAEEGE